MEIINKYTTRTFNTAAGSDELVTVQGIDTEIISALYKGLNEVADQPEMKYSGDEIVDAVAADPLNYETPYQQAYINSLYDKLKAERASNEHSTEFSSESAGAGAGEGMTESTPAAAAD